MSGRFATANPHRIKAAHRRRRKVASGQSVQRYYDPRVGRFWSVDPVTADSVGGNFNWYWYGNNNPYTFKDPDGRQAQPCNDACMRMRATSDDGIQGATAEARASTRGEVVQDSLKGYVDGQAALGIGGQVLVHFFADDPIDALGNAIDGNFKEAAKNLAMAYAGKRVKLLGAAPERMAQDMRRIMISLSGGRRSGAAREFRDASHIVDRSASELASDFMDVAKSHGIPESKIPSWIKRMANE